MIQHQNHFIFSLEFALKCRTLLWMMHTKWVKAIFSPHKQNSWVSREKWKDFIFYPSFLFPINIRSYFWTNLLDINARHSYESCFRCKKRLKNGKKCNNCGFMNGFENYSAFILVRYLLLNHNFICISFFENRNVYLFICYWISKVEVEHNGKIYLLKTFHSAALKMLSMTDHELQVQIKSGNFRQIESRLLKQQLRTFVIKVSKGPEFHLQNVLKSKSI